ncbi:hypothetical protein Y695_03201 [Hydrogenophaga sp. T4]|nr:hypothetical protein Y695_03201 [Hydrogenophaga sp. T4]
MNDTTPRHHKSTPGAKASLNTALSDVVQASSPSPTTVLRCWAPFSPWA